MYCLCVPCAKSETLTRAFRCCLSFLLLLVEWIVYGMNATFCYCFHHRNSMLLPCALCLSFFVVAVLCVCVQSNIETGKLNTRMAFDANDMCRSIRCTVYDQVCCTIALIHYNWEPNRTSHLICRFYFRTLCVFRSFESMNQLYPMNHHNQFNSAVLLCDSWTNRLG